MRKFNENSPALHENSPAPCCFFRGQTAPSPARCERTAHIICIGFIRCLAPLPNPLSRRPSPSPFLQNPLFRFPLLCPLLCPASKPLNLLRSPLSPALPRFKTRYPALLSSLRCFSLHPKPLVALSLARLAFLHLLLLVAF